jgi:hypothetical protein
MPMIFSDKTSNTAYKDEGKAMSISFFNKVFGLLIATAIVLVSDDLKATAKTKLKAEHLSKPLGIIKKKIKNQPIHSGIIIGQIKNALKGLSIHLNNHGKKHDDPNHHKSWLVQESYIIWNKQRIDFFIPELEKEINRRKYYYYVNDFNLKDTEVSVKDNKLQIRLMFETDKHELKGHCLIKRRKAFGGWSSCPAGSDKAAPDFDFVNPELVATAELIPHRGSLSIDNLNIDFTGKAKINGPLVVFSKMASDMIKKELKKHIDQLVNRYNFKDDIADYIRPQLDSLGIGYVVDVKIEGRNFIITYRE